MRNVFILIHRWAGLAMAGFLVIVGLTGSVLAFREELDAWLNPDLLTVPIRPGPMLDPLQLREKAEAIEPRARVDTAPLEQKPGRAFTAFVEARIDPGTGKAFELPFTEMFLDPYTGEKLGVRHNLGEVSLSKEKLISFLYGLHTSLAFPAGAEKFGIYTLGIIALIWTIDCFVSFYLTLPIVRRAREPSAPRKSWWARWAPAWAIKWNGGAYRINFDIHRAFGLWTWAMLFIFAWSSVGFNLNQVYLPVMRLAFDMTLPAELPDLDKPLENPALSWREAHSRGRELLTAAAARYAFTVLSEQQLAFVRTKGVYAYIIRSSRDLGKRGDTNITFDANTGEFKSLVAASTVTTGIVVGQWLNSLHMAQMFGLPMQIFVCVMGLVITALSVTGVYIWLKKRRARKFHFLREVGRPAATQDKAVP